MTGPGGGVLVTPVDEYRFRRYPAPQRSFALPVHGKLQSAFGAAVPPFDMVFPQSYSQKHVVIRKFRDWNPKKDDTGAPLTALLTIFDTGVCKVLVVAEIHAVFHRQGFRVNITSRREGPRLDLVPNFHQSQL
jgi:hypothetical protein